MCCNGFTLKISLVKSKRFEDGRCTYKNTGSSHLKYHPKEDRVVPSLHRGQKSEALRLCFSGSSFTIQVVTWAKM